jgi:hypothetical protein
MSNLPHSMSTNPSENSNIEETIKQLILQTLSECTLNVEVDIPTYSNDYKIIITLKDKDGKTLLTDSDYLPNPN